MAAQALWWEAKGDWHLAHQCAQKQPDADGAWAHAYLHRVEGDLRNAGGWYQPCRQDPVRGAVEGGMGDDRPRAAGLSPRRVNPL